MSLSLPSLRLQAVSKRIFVEKWHTMDFARPASPREPDAGGSAVGVTEADVEARIAAAVAEAEAKAQADLKRQKEEESDAAMAKLMADMAQLKAAGGGGAAAAVPAPAPGSAPAPAPPAPPADPRYADKEFQGKSCARRSSGMRLVIKPSKRLQDFKLDVEASDTIEQVKEKKSATSIISRWTSRSSCSRG